MENHSCQSHLAEKRVEEENAAAGIGSSMANPGQWRYNRITKEIWRKYMKLMDGKVGREYLVEEVFLELTLERRLESLGILPGTHLSILNKKSHGAVIVFVRGARFALGTGIAKQICIKEALQ